MMAAPPIRQSIGGGGMTQQQVQHAQMRMQQQQQQLQMQNQISQETLLRILEEGEILPPYVDINEEILRTKDEMQEEQANELEMEAARIEVAEVAAAEGENEGGVTSGKAAAGGSSGNNTLPTPLRPGKHAD